MFDFFCKLYMYAGSQVHRSAFYPCPLLLYCCYWYYIADVCLCCQADSPATSCGHETPTAMLGFLQFVFNNISAWFCAGMYIFCANTICCYSVLLVTGSCCARWWVAKWAYWSDVSQHDRWESCFSGSNVGKTVSWVTHNSYLWHVGKDCTWQGECLWY